MSGPLTSHNKPLPACGKCGYPARGIESLHCPECGADLREVGIVRPGLNKGALLDLIWPVVFTVAVLIAAVNIEPFVSGQLPTYYEERWSVTLESHSDAYGLISFDTEIHALVPPGHTYTSVTANSGLSYSSSGSSVATLQYPNFTTPTTIRDLNINFDIVSHSPATRGLVFKVDPQTRHAWWNNSQGQTLKSGGVFTGKDVLAFLALSGADTTNPDVIREAQELHTLLDGFAGGMDQFTLNEFDELGMGGGSGFGGKPAWFQPTYFGGWVVIWIAGLFLIAKRYNRQTMTQTKS